MQKKIILCLALLGSSLSARTKQSSLEIMPVRTWQEFENRHQASEQKVILCCTLLLNRGGDALKLKKLVLQWQPDHQHRATPQHITPSLYESHLKKPFKPGTAVLSNGIWHASSKTMHFPLDFKLLGKPILHVVVLAPKEDAQLLKHGKLVYTDQYPLVTEKVL